MSVVTSGAFVEGLDIDEKTLPVLKVKSLLDLVEGGTAKHVPAAKAEIAAMVSGLANDLHSALADVDFLTQEHGDLEEKLKAAEAIAAKPAKVPAASKVASKLLLQAVALRKASRVEGADMAALQEDATLRSGAWCAKEGTTLAQAHSAASAAASEAKAHVEAHNMWGEWL